MQAYRWLLVAIAALPLAAQAQSGPQGDTWESIARLPDLSGLWEITFGGGPRGPGEPPSLTPPYAARLKSYQEAEARG
ncbi:MAG TPA: hypothetical protein VFB99_13955, partial [Vicinamibacterales bacterium]|nr:hypothetical protein [Vicinamibacterales bacterium]